MGSKDDCGGRLLFHHAYERLRFQRLYRPDREFARLIENRSGVIAVSADGVVYGGGIYDGSFNVGLRHDNNFVIRTYAGLSLHPAPREILLIGLSTGSWAPFWIINGPVRNDSHINSGAGALSPGDIANAAIGRAFGLIIKNIGGARKGLEDMGGLGNPAKYSMVLAENEENSPWEPLHEKK